MFTLEKYTEKFFSKWNHFVKEAKNGLFFFDRNFMEYHKDRFTDHSLVFLKGEEIIAVFPASENQDTVISHGGLTFGSLFISKSLKAVDVLSIFEQIVSYYSSKGFKKIIYKAIPYIFNQYPAQEDLYALFRLDATLVRRDISSVIEIKNRIKFSETKRQLINKCKKNNVTVKKSGEFGNYWSLLTEVLSKFDASPVHSLQEINLLKDGFPENINLYEAYLDEELLAGIVIFDFGQTVHTQYMAASATGRKMGALDYINSHLIEDVYSDREYYSFGISTEEAGRFLNEGLIQQKENMGGRAVTLDFYSIDLTKTKQ